MWQTEGTTSTAQLVKVLCWRVGNRRVPLDIVERDTGDSVLRGEVRVGGNMTSSASWALFLVMSTKATGDKRIFDVHAYSLAGVQRKNAGGAQELCSGAVLQIPNVCDVEFPHAFSLSAVHSENLFIGNQSSLRMRALETIHFSTILRYV